MKDAGASGRKIAGLLCPNLQAVCKHLYTPQLT